MKAKQRKAKAKRNKRKKAREAPKPDFSGYKSQQDHHFDDVEFQLGQVQILCSGRESVCNMWTDELTPEEKKQVLDVQPDEIIDSLVDLGLPRDVLSQSGVAKKMLGNHEVMTLIRLTFMSAMHNKGAIPSEIPQDIILIRTLQIIERHMMMTYERRALLTKLYILILFWIWNWNWTFIIRYPAMIVVLLFIFSSSPYATKVKSSILTIFEDPLQSADRMVARMSILSSGVLAVSTGYWLQGIGGCVVAILPAILLELETLLVKETKIFKLGRMLSQIASEIMLLYLSFYSYWWFIFNAAFFFPTITAITFGFSCTLLAHLALYAALINNKVCSMIKAGLMLQITIFLTALTHFIYTNYWIDSDHVSDGGWFDGLMYLLHLVFLLLCMPAALTALFEAALTSVSSILVDSGVSGLIAAAGGAVLIVGLLLFAQLAKLLCPHRLNKQDKE